MRVRKGFFVVFTCFLLLFVSSAKDESLAACSPPVKIPGYAYNPTSIQDAYDYASNNLGLSSFTLLLAGQIFYEDLTLDGGEVLLDGGYDCSFTNKDSTTGILGTITIGTGSVNWAGGVGVVSTDRCDFDTDLDGFTRIGSCAGSADDCNDYDPAINLGALEICDGIDNNCNGQIDEGLTGTDADGDGYYAYGSCGAVGTDCNDADVNIHPDALDIPYDGIDQDCSGADLTFAGETCDGCHWLPTIANHHVLTTPPDGTCVSCHASQVGNVAAGHYGKTVKTAGNNMAAGEIITCTACHDQSEPVHGGGQIGANGNGSDFVTNKLFPAWITDPPSITCDTCHEDRAAAHAAAHDHRVITTVCANCHSSDTTVIGQPGNGTLTSAADVDALHRSDCTLCHGYSGTNLDPTVVAQAIRDGISGTDINCLTCHTNFETVHAFLDNHNNLVQVGTTSCGNCHSDPPPLVDPTDPKVHSACSNCHDANYNRISLAAGKSFDVGGDCTTCHTDTFDTIHPSNVDHSSLVRVGTTGCGNCHSDPPPLVDASDPKVHNGCTTCHDSEGGLIGIAAGKSFAVGGDCITCHTDFFDTIHPDTIDHSALIKVETTSCGNCHSDPPPLVDPIDPKVHNACTTCHDFEGRLINDAAGKSFDSPGNCTTCHTEPFYSVHPDDIDHSALVKVGTTSCGNCHSDPPPLVDPVDPKVHNVCATCHDSEGGLISLATGKSFDSPGDCTTCHTVPFDTIHPDDIDHSALIKVETTSCGNCHSDPPPLVDPLDSKVHDACTTCHDSGGGLINLAAGKSFDFPGNCTTCHTDPFGTIHPDTIDHSALIKVETTSCGNCHSDPPPLVDQLDPKVHDACSTCHDSGGGLINLAAGKSFDYPGNCTTCHTSTFDTIHPDDVSHSQAIQLSTDCNGCHNAPPPLVDPGDPKVHDACTTCHDANGGLISLASGKTAPNECITCHGDDLTTLHPTSSASHEATPGSQDVLVYAEGAHDSSMVGDGTVYIACSTCHDTLSLGNIHDNNCATCHSGNPSPYEALGGSWAGGCQQGACHATYHADVTEKHNEVTDYSGESNCTYCHGEGLNDFPPLPSSCSNCHATDYSGDTEAPVTTSDVQSVLLVPTVINYSITDNGGKVSLGTTYSRLDGGQSEVGTSFLVETVGSHTLEFWTVDQAGNEELPHNFVNFTGTNDITPPVTTSNAHAVYETDADITLTATDDNPVGVVTTYYSLDGGQVQTGNSVHVAEQDGTFSYSLEYWSVDGAGNEELPHHTANFTIYGGTATLRLVWGDSDISGSSCDTGYPGKINWEIHHGSYLVSSGHSECGAGGWGGVNDIAVPVSTTSYYVDIWWWESDGEYYELSEFPNVEASTHGEVVRVSYP